MADTGNVPATKSNPSWSIESLLKAAFARFKDRFLGYLIVLLIGVGIAIVAFLVIILMGVVAGASYLTVFKGNPANIASSVGIYGLLISLVFLVAIVYFASWVQLSMYWSIIRDTKLPGTQYYKETRPYVWKFLGLQSLIGLFFFGLLPFLFLSLFVILFVWAFWAAFVTFVFLQKHLKGIQNLWGSKQIVGQNFWGVVGRILLVTVAVWMVSFLFGAGGKNGELQLLNVIFGFIVGPFVIAYNYEIYKHLDTNVTPRTPVVWVVLSVVGWVIVVGSIVFFGPKVVDYFQNLAKPRDIHDVKVQQPSAPRWPYYKEY